MTKIEKILLGILLVSGVSLEIAKSAYHVEFWAVFVGIFFLALGAVLIYYFKKNNSLLFSIVIILWLIEWFGLVFKILHLTGADEIMLIGSTAHIIFAAALLWIVYKTSPKPDLFYYVIGIALLLNSFFNIGIAQHLFRVDEQLANSVPLLNYVIVGSIGTIKLKELTIKPEVDRLLNIYLIQSIIFVTGQLLTKF